jgi:hypothetical protein
MAARNLFDPEPQREILRLYTLSNTDDPGLTEALVPEEPAKVTDSVHDAQLAAGVLMQGLPVALKTGMNHIEYVEALMNSMAAVIKKIEQRGGMATPDELVGLQNMYVHIGQHIQLIAQDPNEKQRVKQYGDSLGKMGNMMKGYAQRLEEQMKEQAQAQGGNGADPKDAAKAQAMVISAETKAELTKDAHKQRTAQRQVQWQLDQQRKEQEHEMAMRQQAQQLQWTRPMSSSSWPRSRSRRRWRRRRPTSRLSSRRKRARPSRSLRNEPLDSKSSVEERTLLSDF